MFNKFDSSIAVLSPVNGTVKKIEDVKDPVLNSGMIGKGAAVMPSDGEVFPVFNGDLVVSFGTGHAYGIQHKKGPQALIHFGVDTVGLDGKGFTKTDIPQGSKVKISQKLVDVDLDVLKENKKMLDCIVLITNETLGEYKVTKFATGPIKVGEPLFYLEK